MNGGNMQKMMKQMQKMQKDMERMQEEIGQRTVEATVGGGAVTVTASGSQEIKAVKINPDAVDLEDIEMLEDMVLAACNEAMKKAQDMMSTELGKITGGMNIPGLF
ncbi:MAG: YbaB/EbfC family nucleoid-associated protein [Clostridiales bacterium]